MCIGFFKKLLGLDNVEGEDTELHEYQKTGIEPETAEVNTDDDSSSEEIEFDEEGIFQGEDSEQKYSLPTPGPGNEIENINDEEGEVQGASSSDDEAEEANPQVINNKSEIATFEPEDTQETEMSLPIPPIKSKSKKGKKKKQGNSFGSKAHERFQSKGKKILNKRKLKMKKKPVQKTEVT